MASRPNEARLERVRDRLDALLDTHDAAAHRRADPVSFVHAAAPEDREVVALLAALLAFGNVVAIRRSIARALERLGPSPAAVVDGASLAELDRRLDGFAHRVWKGPDVARMLAGAGRIRREHGTLGEAMRRHLDATGDDLRESLARLADGLRGDQPAPGLKHLVPDPRAGSACKRLLLFVRWMTRPADGVDLGLWPVDPALLVIPVDTHVQRIAQNLWLTRRRDASWRTAEEITSSLRRFDPRDPVKYDFALCHLGISRRCPSRRDPDLCGECVLRTVCRRWVSSRGARAS